MIILVDDNADQRLVLRLALEQGGYSVREAANGREGLSLQRAPGVGVDHGHFHARSDYLASVKLMGVDATLEKPFQLETLLKVLSAMGVPHSVQ